MSAVGENIRKIREEIAEAALKSGREPSAVRLMAVTKTVDDDRILEAIEAGVDIWVRIISRRQRERSR